MAGCPLCGVRGQAKTRVTALNLNNMLITQDSAGRASVRHHEYSLHNLQSVAYWFLSFRAITLNNVFWMLRIEHTIHYRYMNTDAQQAVGKRITPFSVRVFSTKFELESFELFRSQCDYDNHLFHYVAVNRQVSDAFPPSWSYKEHTIHMWLICSHNYIIKKLHLGPIALKYVNLLSSSQTWTHSRNLVFIFVLSLYFSKLIYL